MLNTIGAWLAAHPANRMQIVVCAFAEANVIAYEKALAAQLQPGWTCHPPAERRVLWHEGSSSSATGPGIDY